MSNVDCGECPKISTGCVSGGCAKMIRRFTDPKPVQLELPLPGKEIVRDKPK